MKNKYLILVDCKSVQKLTNAKMDGEYEMQVFGHDNQIAQVFIYCHAMNNDHPTEFLSLPAGENKNFVTIEKDSCGYSKGKHF